ncbi:MAG: hypothetical protein U9R44_05635 [Candidatus Omnitrophota bacterium]|nr:hypothetical protein [Candidatus Omnitrophota bacterium]
MNVKQIIIELEKHIPFTGVGVVTGIIFMILFRGISSNTACRMFHIFHPIHVFLSALVTASMLKVHRDESNSEKCNFLEILLIGIMGAVGIATLSDSVIPYVGEVLLHLPNRGVHIGFIEKWWLVFPCAILGITVAHFCPRTKFPHAGHVLLSTWASLFHIITALGQSLTWGIYVGIFVFLFLSVWLPCCVSDIVFPLVFVQKSVKIGLDKDNQLINTKSKSNRCIT